MTTKNQQELERTLRVGTKVLLFNASLAVLLLIITLIRC